MRRPGHLAAVPTGASPPAPTGVSANAQPSQASGAAQEWDATVDGSRVLIQARDEVVIQCGQASITMRRNGRIVIRGTYVETRSAGTNRIRGGQVRVN